jgi:hypothetical protein
MRRTLLALATLLLAATAAAQQRPIFDVDDFVDPRQHDGVVLATRLVVGGVNGYIDDYRPLDRNAHLAHLANSVYWRDFQADYKHSEVRAAPPPPVQVCNCNPPVYFPVPPQDDETPRPPRPGGRDTLQLAWYGQAGDNMLRYRVSVTNQNLATDVFFPNTNKLAQTLHGRERSVGIEGDTWLPLLGFGTVNFARTVRSGTPDPRAQSELAYTSRLPGFAWKRLLFRSTLTVGGVTGRGAGGVNVVHPIFEAFWHDQTTRMNFHLAWSPSSTRNGSAGWKTHHQIALFVDRGIVKLFRPSGSRN